MTNADKIRAMTDEELTEWISRVTGSRGLEDAWLKWLKQEVRDDE